MSRADRRNSLIPRRREAHRLVEPQHRRPAEPASALSVESFSSVAWPAGQAGGSIVHSAWPSFAIKRISVSTG
jgi:hypothetical protein